MARTPKTPWHRLWLAATNGTGCRLSAEDCFRLSQDDAIMKRGEGDAVRWRAKQRKAEDES